MMSFVSPHDLKVSTKKEIEFSRLKSQIKWSPIFMIFLLVVFFMAIKLIADDFPNFSFLASQSMQMLKSLIKNLAGNR
jgi:hypothetical protein